MDTTTSVTFQVSPNSGEPIFRQLMDQVKRFVACGQLASGDTLPSVRQMARTLSVNPMTVSKAYSHLELEGVVERKAGVGMLVKAACADDEMARLALLRPALDELLLQAGQLELSLEALIAALNDRSSDLIEEETL
jgi:GntR family transcriptional regulator